MRKILALCLVLMLSTTFLFGCSLKCEHCGKTNLSYNVIGSSADGIRLCNDCVEDHLNGKIRLEFTCDNCGVVKVGKKNEVTIDGDAKIVCNTCKNELQ